MAHAFRSFRLFVLPALLVGCGSSPAPADKADSTTDPLLGAAADTTHRFDVGICAGGLVAAGQPNAGTCSAWDCSGTLVAPNLVLTARHCIRQISYAANFCDSTFTSDPLTVAAMLVTTSNSSVVGTPKWYDVKTELVPAGTGLCSDDLALLVLTEPVPPAEAVPVAVNLFRDVAARPPKSVAIVGRGAITDVLDLSTFNETTDDGNWQRRVLQNIPFDCATDAPAAPCNVVDFSSPPSNAFASPPSYFVIGSSLASGDSGSGVFDQATFNGLRSVIGVSSAATYGPDGVPNHGLVSRLDTHRNFLIDGFLQAFAALSAPPGR
jgi:hypothetical protein